MKSAKKNDKKVNNNENTDIEDISLQVQSYIKKIGLKSDNNEIIDNKSSKKKKKSHSPGKTSSSQLGNNSPKFIKEKENQKSITKKKDNQNRNDKLDVPSKTTKKKKKVVDMKNVFEYTKQEYLLMKNKIPWYEKIIEIPKEASKLSVKELDSYLEVSNSYWEDELSLYQKMRENDKSSDAQWLRTVLTSGTMADKLAALTMITQESPVHSKRSLDSLMNYAKKKSRREALVAIDSLRHLWISDLLPDVKLRYFHEYQVEDIAKLSKTGSEEDQIQLLITMAFENYLKKTYAEFIEVIQGLSKDPLMNIRNKILGIIYELLTMKPEQEHILLSTLVNKLGDPERQISSKASYLLQQLVQNHPNMQNIVIDEVERMIYRPNVSQKSQYYAIVFLNQNVLSHQKKDTAAKLMKFYLNFFKVLAKQKENKKRRDQDAKSQEIKVISGLLTGVNRAFPFVEDVESIFDEHIDTLFKLTHSQHFSTSLQALMLIFQVMETRESISDRYYKALYEKLLDPEIKTTSRQVMMLNLIFKSLKNDVKLNRTKSFMKRLLQETTKEQPSLLCGVLFLLSEVVKSKPGLRTLLEQPEDNDEDDEEETFKDAPEISDGDGDIPDDEDDDDDDDDDDDVESNKKNDENNNDSGKKTEPSWSFRKNEANDRCYKISHRNPLWAGGEFSCAWEIIPLLNHFHPSVQHFSSFFLQGEPIKYDGDPLHDFTTIRFLDRFMYRNPKKKEKEHGSSLMQPKERSSRLHEQPVNSKMFLQKSEDKIRHDEKFFYQFFKMKDSERKKNEKIKETDENEDEEEQDDNIDFDFAGELRNSKAASKRPKTDNTSDADSDFDSDIQASTDEEDGSFDYDDIGSDLSEDHFETDKTNFTDADYEKALLDNLSSEEDGDDDDDDDEMPSNVDADMFATADEFAHLLEKDDDDVISKKSKMKQKQWEERTNDWKSKKRNSRKRKIINNQHNKYKKRKI